MNRHEARAHFFVFAQSGFHGGAHIVRQTFAKKFGWNADAQTIERIVQFQRKIFARHIDRSGISIDIRAAHGGKQNRAIFRRTRHRPRLVEARRERNHAVARSTPVSRFNAGDAAKRSGLANRTARIRARCRRSQTRRHRRRATARRTARNTGRIPRVFYVAVSRVFVA